jgi:hypothetical protein
MPDRDQGTEALGTAPNGNLLPAEAAKAVGDLQRRVTRLEDALASVQDTGLLEERVCERVARRLERGAREAESRHLLVGAGQHLLPTALHLMRDASGSTAEPLPGEQQGRPWFLYDLYAEGRAIVRMYLDRRYRLPWLPRVVPLILLAAILTSSVWFPGTSISVVGTIIDKAVDLLLAFCAFKILSREARRYRAALGEIPADSRP